MDTTTPLAAAVECLEGLDAACPHLAPALRSRPCGQAARLVDEGRLAEVDALAEIRIAPASILAIAPRLPAVRALPSEARALHPVWRMTCQI